MKHLILLIGLQLVYYLVASKNIKENIKGNTKSLEDDEANDFDRGIGFGKGRSVDKSKPGTKVDRPFAIKAPSNWTEDQDFIDRTKKKYNDTDPDDYDYFAHYDFEFAKSGLTHRNFQQKYLHYQKVKVAELKNKTLKKMQALTATSTTTSSPILIPEVKPVVIEEADTSSQPKNKTLSTNDEQNDEQATKLLGASFL